MKNLLLFLCLGFCLFSCKSDSAKTAPIQIDPADGLTVTKAFYGNTPDGPADIYTLTNKSGMEVKISNYGGIIASLKVADKNGQFEDVVLGFDSLSGYLSSANPYFGGIIGRYGNRIAKGVFTIDDQQFIVAQNDGANHLHGGVKGFDKVLWDGKIISGGDSKGIELFYHSKDLEEGYPGNMNVKVVYLLNNQNELMVRYEANSDKPTICNLTNHTYFNLAGEGNGDILNHLLRIDADWITPVDKTLIPTGAMKPVKGTPFDFRAPKPIGRDIAAKDQQIKYGNGYDHNFALGDKKGKREFAASAYEPNSGRFLEVFTEEPGIQFYTGNFLKGDIAGKKGHKYDFRTGFCLETQHYPDSPNHPKFPSTTLRPEEVMKTSTMFRFSVK